MSCLDEQIRQKKQNDEEDFEEAFAEMASAVMGKKFSFSFKDDRAATQNAVDEILEFYHEKKREIPNDIEGINEQLEYLMRPYGIMRRTVSLDKGWYKDAVGAMIGTMKESGKAVAFIPGKLSGYSYSNPETGKREKIGKKNQELFEREAFAFYKPFPMRKMNIWTLVKYIWDILSPSDYLMMALSVLAVILVGMLTPEINNLLFSKVLPSGEMQLLLAMTVFMVCAAVSNILLTSVNQLMTERIETKMSLSVESATMMRVLSLPADFFRRYSAGELSNRTGRMNSLCNMLVSSVFSSGLTSIFSLIYITQIFLFAPALTVPAITVIIVTVIFSVISSLIQTRILQGQMELASKESGMTYALITGIQKIKLSGAEKRAFARWGRLYAQEAKSLYDPPTFIKINKVISTGISLVGTIIIYYEAIHSGISVADYYAFNTAYGMTAGAFSAMAGTALTAAQIKPVLEMVRPIFDTVPEISKEKRVVKEISGEIEMNHVSFRYNENMPLIMDDLSLKINQGQYVAVVGQTGCGKSTLIRLLLGFEKPQKGAIYYDGRDMDKIDLKSLRRKIGVVMQNGKLFQGDIYSNIVISAPWLTQEDAWEAAELAGIADDIRSMPMGMHTVISEGTGGLSGGQKQRLMIARAVAPKPKILMFDESTSALDNLTQKKVSESLNALKCTRIVIAHRLSTIQQCDRILVLDKGKIIEDGNYEELIQRKGFFAELVARQRLDDFKK